MADPRIHVALPQRAKPLRVARRRRRMVWLTGGLLGLLGLALGATVPVPLLVWNASASVPIGLYAIAPSRPAKKGDFVVVWLVEPWRGLAATRGYLPTGVLLVKRVAGSRGDQICGVGGMVLLDGKLAAVRRRFDGAGRPLPRWQGCRVLAPGELFLLGDSPASFDGRYFGVVSGGAVIGRAVPLWTR